MISSERKKYLKKRKKEKIEIIFFQIFIIISFIIIWELLSKLKIIDTFLLSSPSNILNTIISLFKSHNLFIHIFITLKEIIIEGGNHSNFGNYGLQENDNLSTIDKETQQERTIQEILKFIEETNKNN